MLNLFFLRGLRLKHTFQKLPQCRFVFRAARIELQRETDLSSFANHFSPKINLLAFGELNLEPDEFFYFNLSAREHEAAAAAQIGNGGILARENTLPPGR